ncbi:hypothetical protein JCM3765_003781 [Sporobolomyces pararoseus]
MKGLLGLYLFSLSIAITCLSLSIDSLLHPNWIYTRRFDSSPSSPIDLRQVESFGFFEKCTITSYNHGDNSKIECRKFPIREQDCKVDSGSSFCDKWLLAGYSHQLSLIFSSTSILSLILTLIGTLRVGRGFRTEKLRSGWKLVLGLMSLQFIFLGLGWLIVRIELDHHYWSQGQGKGKKELGKGFIESVTAFGLLGITIFSILFVRITQRLRIVPSAAAREDGYDEITD